MPAFPLTPHPSTSSPWVKGVRVVVDRQPRGGLRCIYEVEGQIDHLAVPEPGPANRTDELWRLTCFEVFLRTAARTDYDEFNFSPSGEWAAYRFDHYRTGMVELELAAAPRIITTCTAELLRVDASVGAAERPFEQVVLALSAILKDRVGNVSYWALQHPPGKPDFHHEAAFAVAPWSDRSTK
ncbi:MAG TPA: DOMON-like domain-containing protein [Povalibacter sp.]